MAARSPGGEDDDQQQTLVAQRAGGALLLAGSLIVVTVEVLTYLRHTPPAQRDTRPLSMLLTLPAIAVGVMLLVRRTPVQPWVLNVAPSITAILICVPTTIDERPSPLGPVLLMWPVVYAASVLPLRVAWTTMGVVAAAFGVLASFIRGYDGVVLWVEVTASITVVGVMVISLRLKADRLRMELANLARTDALTGLANRRGFDEAIAMAQARQQREGRPLSLLAVDIDHFKQVNDAVGHPAGDEVLRALSSLLCSRVRATDMVGRLGGEEFAVLMPDCGQRQAHSRAEAICEVVRAESKLWDHAITVSVGVATDPDPSGAAVKLQNAADEALYRAKAAGRDRVEGPVTA